MSSGNLAENASVQEWKAEKTVAALASVGAPVAQVLRDGKEVDSKVEEVVP